MIALWRSSWLGLGRDLLLLEGKVARSRGLRKLRWARGINTRQGRGDGLGGRSIVTSGGVQLSLLGLFSRRGDGRSSLGCLFNRCVLRVGRLVRRCSTAFARHPFIVVLAFVRT